jgi:3-methylcrotonyl-CoA carboxylase alpha subunit
MRALRKSTYLSRQLVAANGARFNSTAAAPTAKALTSVLIANRGEIALYDP